MRRLMLLAVTAAALAFPALSQARQSSSPPRYGVSASHERAPTGGRLVIGYATNDPGRWITEFWSMTSRPTVVFARAALDAWEGEEQVRWADSRTCPGLVQTLLEANRLTVPSLIVALDQEAQARSRKSGRPAPPQPDRPGPWVFWAPAQGGSATDVQFSAYGGPWVDWSGRVNTALQPCWSGEMPVGALQD